MPAIQGTQPPESTAAPAAAQIPAPKTPLATEKITAANLARLRQVSSWGRGTIQSLAVSKDGGLAAFVTRQGIALYDTVTFRETGYIEIEGGFPKIAFSPDGQTLAAADNNSHISLFRVKDGAILRVIDPGEVGQPLALSFFPDGTTLYLGTSLELAALWDTLTGKLVHRWITSGGSAMAASPDGYYLVSANYEGNLYIFTANDGKSLGRLWRDSNPECAQFGPDSQVLAACYGDHAIGLWNVMDGKALFTLDGHTDRVAATAFSPDGKLLASASWDKTLKLWDTTRGEEIASLEGHTGRVLQVAFANRGRSLISASEDGTVRVWSIPDGRLLKTIDDFIPLGRALFSPDGRTVATGVEDGAWRIWNSSDGSLVRSAAAHPGGISALAFAPDSSTLVTGGIDQAVRAWRVADGTLLWERTANDSWINSLDISPDGRLAASSMSGSASVQVLSLADGTSVQKINTGGDAVLKVRFDPRGGSLWSAAMDGSLKQWRVDDGSLLATLKDSGPFLSSLAFTPDGQWLAAGGDDRRIDLWKLDGSRLHRIFDGIKDGGVSGLAFAPEGELLFATYWDKSLRIYTVPDGGELRRIDFPFTVRDLSVSPNGALLALSLEDGTVRIWGVK